MDPAVVGSAQFGQIFKTKLPGNYDGVPEQVFASPLVYTTGDGVQYIYLATQQNNIYKLNAKTGAIVASRNLHIPFLTADLDGCVDINPHVGSTATGVIDPNTNTWYLTTKTYADQGVKGAQGRPNGRYYVHAISVDDLSERSNFPVDLEGTVARNNPARSFNGGIHHQRPALLQQGQYIYAGFASHCVQYNFTGWIMGWDKDTGKTVERYATEGAGVKNTVPGAGVWMSGGGLASDNAGSMFFASGNGYASQLNGIPVSGRQPPTSLEEAAVHMTINGDGSLTPVDFFMPWEKTQLDGADKDLGTSPLELLPSQFSCGNVKRIGVVTGKSGKTYWLDLDNMGGYQNGANKLDNVLQVYQNENSVYAGAGVYPLEGGYIYINVIQYPTHVFKFSCDNGVPSFTKVADSPEKNAYILGVGHGTTTSLKDQAGTGLVWTSDVEGSNLRIYNAVPQNGQLTLINSFNVPGTTKFSRPVFGDGRVYMITTLGYFYGFGSPVNLPLNCSSPYDFGTVDLNSTSVYKTIQCQANVDTQVTGLSISGNKNFILGNSSTLPVSVPMGKTFSFQAAFKPAQVGSLSSDVLVNTTQGAAVTGFTTSTPVRLKGVGQSTSAILAVTPNTVSFDGVITGQQTGGVSQSVILLNIGNANLTITGIQCSDASETGPFTTKQVVNASVSCGPFTFTKIPTTIAGNSQATVNIAFDPQASGNYATFLNVQSTGGTKVIDVLGVAGDYPSALLEFQTPDGTGWVKYDNSTPFTFGDVLENTSRNLKMRLTNQGTNSSTRLSVTVSKPPFGVSGIIGAANQVDLAEGTTLAPGESATATLYCSVPKSQINVDSYSGSAGWTMNLGDPSFGKQHIQFACNAVSEQSLPQFANGTAKYRYQGCYKENNPGRQMKTQIYGNGANTNEMCTKACSDAGYTYAGTQYLSECWCSPYPPTLQVDEANCNFACSSNINEICGGNGVDQAGSYISLFMDVTQGAGSVPKGPFVNNGTNGYTSIGCYTEGTGGRALSIGKGLGQATNVANCTAACQGYAYAGVEYGQECYCGNTIGTGSVPAPLTDCNMVCAGNSSEYCGAGSRLNMYALNVSATSTSASSASASATSSPSATPTGPVHPPKIGSYSFVDCHTEATNGRALAGKTVATDDMTLDKCAESCSGFLYFGVEYSRECYCGNTIGTGSITASLADCNMVCAGSGSEYCGAGNRLSLYALNSTTTSTSSSAVLSSASVSASAIASPSATPTGPVHPPAIGSYKFLNCQTEATNARALTDKTVASDDMTLDKCAATCSGFLYFGVEYSRECYCGNNLGTGSVTAPLADCSMLCAGNSLEYCGAGNRLSLYAFNATTSSSTSSSAGSSSVSASASASASASTSATASPSATPTGPVQPPTVGSYKFVDCHTEGTNARALTGKAVASDDMTLDKCAVACSGFLYFGVEYSRECYCGNTLSAGSVTTLDGRCSMLCAGDKLQYCGGSNGLSLYMFSNTTTTSTSAIASTVVSSSASSSVASSSAAVSNTTSIPAASSTSSVTQSVAPSNASSISVVASSSASSAAASSSSSAVLSSSSSSAIASSSVSSKPAASSSASSTISSAPASSSVAPSSSASKSASLTSSSASLAPSASASATPWQYLGCANETNPRALSLAATTSNTMTIQQCQSYCLSKNLPLAGLEYGKECYCGTALQSYSTLGFTGCNMACAGSSSDICGGSSRLSVYNYTSYVPPQLVASVGTYQLQGCYTEPSNGRALAAYSFTNSTGMSAEWCVSGCQLKGYAYAGMEYGQECWCDNKLSTSSAKVTDSSCNMLCPGNQREYCGAGGKLALYKSN
ncbi:hypothetical protein I302_102492 [Kwoniella bestiolae CBS 10118]|uniref:WSC domain-containing protein n=1 Tax=Kwoniella bestiolae CBS 10118 TaxID=1296100 RepID=A0A1B9GFF1_9TREE|nr:hypothetical protein I302_01182 [Kwoniella bestiolae CBS 10118]OCF29671.1 hypothetical protein I302_01182 [Kwoniella bestiolae CBS 10118]